MVGIDSDDDVAILFLHLLERNFPNFLNTFLKFEELVAKDALVEESPDDVSSFETEPAADPVGSGVLLGD
jgi:hypothetical protein